CACHKSGTHTAPAPAAPPLHGLDRGGRGIVERHHMHQRRRRSRSADRRNGGGENRARDESPHRIGHAAPRLPCVCAQPVAASHHVIRRDYGRIKTGQRYLGPCSCFKMLRYRTPSSGTREAQMKVKKMNMRRTAIALAAVVTLGIAATGNAWAQG